MNDLIDRAAILEEIEEKINEEQLYPEDPIINKGLRIAQKCIKQAKTVKSVSEDEMKAEIAYLEKRHREECSMLIAERDLCKARYDEILNYLSQQVQEKKIELVFSESQSKQIAKMLGIRGEENANALAESEPVRQGRWISLDGWFNKSNVKCSVCGNTLNMDGVNAGRGDANFCPNCGSTMDGGAENDER